MKSASDISLVVPTYNRAHLIAETLDSALAQDLPFREIVVVDNGSTDDTPVLLQRYSGSVRVLRTAQSGVQAARNLGAMSCETRYVAFCDSDDLLERGYVGAVHAALHASPGLDAVYVNFANFSADRQWPDKLSQAPEGWLDGLTEQAGCLRATSELPRKTMRFQPLFPSGLVVSREVFTALGGFDEAFRGVGAEDWEFTLRLTERARVGIHRHVLARIRRHEGNDSKNAAYMSAGEAKILQHALTKHHWVQGVEAEVQRHIHRRLQHAFEGYIGSGLFSEARTVVPDWRQTEQTTALRLKRALLRMPEPLRSWLWQAHHRRAVKRQP